MPSRNLVYEALALRTREVPSGARVLTMLTAEAGVVDAFVFGGPKSKLRSLASPWSSGRVFLYHDPVRDYLKLNDFEVVEPFSGLREGLRRLFGASLVAELAIKTSGGGGDSAALLDLARGCLRRLEIVAEERADYPLLLFIWRLVDLLGLLPDLGTCVLCERELGPAEPRTWLGREGGFACPSCRPAEGEGAPWLSPGALRWLGRARGLGFPEADAVGLDQASLGGLRRLCFALARSSVEAPLDSLEAGAGIL